MAGEVEAAVGAQEEGAPQVVVALLLRLRRHRRCQQVGSRRLHHHGWLLAEGVEERERVEVVRVPLPPVELAELVLREEEVVSAELPRARVEGQVELGRRALVGRLRDGLAVSAA